MKKVDLTFGKEKRKNGSLNFWIDIDPLLSESDYDAWWAGENGADGYETDRVKAIRAIGEKYSAQGSWIDIQIWEHGNATMFGIDGSKLEDIRKEFELLDNQSYELAESL